MNTFKDSFQKTVESFGSSYVSYGGENYVNKVQEEIEKTVHKMIGIGKTDKNIHYIKALLSKLAEKSNGTP